MKLEFIPVKMRLPLKFGAETIESIQIAHVEFPAYGAVGRGETPLSVAWAWPSTLSFALREKMMCKFCEVLAASYPAPEHDPMTAGYLFLTEKLDDLLKKFNAELLKMKESGELDRIINHYKTRNNNETENGGEHPDNSFLGVVKSSFTLNFIKDSRYVYLLQGLLNTLQITFFSLLIGIVIGFAVAVVRSTADQTGRLKFLNWVCKFYLTIIRGTPVVVQLLIIYFVVFGAVDIDKVLVAIIAFGINSGAYVAEIIRGGIMSIDKGQMEAGRSLGLSYIQSMRLIIIPQAFKTILPTLCNEFIVLLKETSVAGYVGVMDLTKAGDIIRGRTFSAFMPLIAVALIYLALVMFLTSIVGRVERRLRSSDH